jgi:hypothetical protein
VNRKLIVIFIIVFCSARENPFEITKFFFENKEPVHLNKAKKQKKIIVEEVPTPPLIPVEKSSFFPVYDWLKYEVLKNTLAIHTSDPLVNSYLSEDKLKLILDFKSKKIYATKTTFISGSDFVKKIQLGFHADGFYRIVIFLKYETNYLVQQKENKVVILFFE